MFTGDALLLFKLVVELTAVDESSVVICGGVTTDGGVDVVVAITALVTVFEVVVGGVVAGGGVMIVVDVVEPVDVCPIEFSIFTVDGMATNVMLDGCRDILNVLNLLSGSNTTLNKSNKYELSRFKCSAHNCMNLMHEFNIQQCILYFHELTASSVRIFTNETVRPSR